MMAVESFHSISFPSEWGPTWSWTGRPLWRGFHSISFPSEWGPGKAAMAAWAAGVSIQLVSPASGDF